MIKIKSEMIVKGSEVEILLIDYIKELNKTLDAEVISITPVYVENTELKELGAKSYKFIIGLDIEMDKKSEVGELLQ